MSIVVIIAMDSTIQNDQQLISNYVSLVGVLLGHMEYMEMKVLLNRKVSSIIVDIVNAAKKCTVKNKRPLICFVKVRKGW